MSDRRKTVFDIPPSEFLNKSERQKIKIKKSIIYAIRNRISKHHRQLPDNEIKAIISLTSFPKRIRCLYMTIESLFEQTCPADKIILWLSEDEFNKRKLPRTILRLQKRGLEVKWVSGNLKPYKKLYYSLKAYPDQLIITVDDDTFYPNFLIEGLLKTHQKFPKSVICYRSKKVSFDSNGNLLPYSQWNDDHDNHPNPWSFPQGVGGVLYPPNALSKQTLDKDLFTTLSPTADDIWFKAMALINNTLTMKVTCQNIEFPKIIGSQSASLHKINNQQKQNDIQMKCVFDHFNINKQTFLKLNKESHP